MPVKKIFIAEDERTTIQIKSVVGLLYCVIYVDEKIKHKFILDTDTANELKEHLKYSIYKSEKLYDEFKNKVNEGGKNG
jgi:hypothetical protein